MATLAESLPISGLAVDEPGACRVGRYAFPFFTKGLELGLVKFLRSKSPDSRHRGLFFALAAEVDIDGLKHSGTPWAFGYEFANRTVD